MNIFHDLLKQYNMTLLTSAVVTDNTDIKVLISRFLVSHIVRFKVTRYIVRGGNSVRIVWLRNKTDLP